MYLYSRIRMNQNLNNRINEKGCVDYLKIIIVNDKNQANQWLRQFAYSFKKATFTMHLISLC